MFFGISLGKILLLAGILLVVWYGFKVAGRVAETRRGPRRSRRSGSGSGQNAAATMRRCPHCGTYTLAPSGTACGNPDCSGTSAAG